MHYTRVYYWVSSWWANRIGLASLRRSPDCRRLFVCVTVCVGGFVALFHSQLRASFTYFGDLLRCPYKHIVNIMKVYIKRNNVQVELIRFRNN